ncbi:MAG: hypothetical protein EHM33_28985 [Chloroflexi bacterium]|nr:MAG: hypothetical protein EHM33_28985 [Chloroflexota bacterium]
MWTTIHGMVFGFIFLLGFSGALYAVYAMRPEWLTAEGMKRTINLTKASVWALAISAWAAVITGTYIVYPWYRARPPEGTTDLGNFPRYLLLADPSTAEWHRFGMEWKEHVAFLAPMAATVVAFIVSYYGPTLARKVGERRAVMIFFIVSFAAAAAAGLFGAFITKAAPVR